MIIPKRMLQKIVLISVFSLLHLGLFAQNYGPGVGKWRALYSYLQATALSSNETKYFVGTESGFYVYDRANNEISTYSKINGLSDVSIVDLATDKVTGFTLLAYENANLDIYKDGNFYNVPDFKISSVIGDKTINDVQANDGKAYMSTPLGLIVVDLIKKEIDQTTPFYLGSEMGKVNSSFLVGDSIYVATSVGVFKTNINNGFFQNYASWQKISELAYSKITGNKSHIYAYNEADNKIYKLNHSGTATLFESPSHKVADILIAKNNGIWIATEYESNAGEIYLLDPSGTTKKSTPSYFPTAMYEANDQSLFFTERLYDPSIGGLREFTNGPGTSAHNPNGPVDNSSTDVWAYDGEVWVAHGSINAANWGGIGKRTFFSSLINNEWRNYANEMNALGISFLSDASRIIKDRSTNNVYVSNAWGGLTVYNNGTISQFKEGYFENKIGDANAFINSGAALDKDGNLWLTNFAAPNELKVKTKDGNWYKFHASSNPISAAADVVIDDYGYKWYLGTLSSGVIIYNDNGTLENKLDDQSRVLRTGENNGNLPSMNTTAIAVDLDGAIWIGTDNGIAVVDRSKEALAGSSEADRRPVDYDGDGNYSYLFDELSVTSIAVDGANRKWIATNSGGVWLISEDAQQIILHFNESNSPLPTNKINSINIDPITGDVYFSSDKGLMVYRGDAVEANSSFTDPLFVYPNPVPSGYEGMITIKGMKNESDVKITDVAGQLVYATYSNGGEATWNGKDYTGRKAQSGVYLIFAVDKNGEEKQTGKFIIHE